MKHAKETMSVGRQATNLGQQRKWRMLEATGVYTAIMVCCCWFGATSVSLPEAANHRWSWSSPSTWPVLDGLAAKRDREYLRQLGIEPERSSRQAGAGDEGAAAVWSQRDA